jgi:hypothetical protein
MCIAFFGDQRVLRPDLGPGLCHGLADSGYAFLALYRATCDADQLYRAKAFARVLMDPEFEVFRLLFILINFEKRWDKNV